MQFNFTLTRVAAKTNKNCSELQPGLGYIALCTSDGVIYWPNVMLPCRSFALELLDRERSFRHKVSGELDLRSCKSDSLALRYRQSAVNVSDGTWAIHLKL